MQDRFYRPRTWCIIALLSCFLLGLGTGCSETVYRFEDVAAGSEDDNRDPRSRSNSQFLRAVYADLLGRSPEIYDFVITAEGTELVRFPIDEQDFLLNALDGIGDPVPIRSLIVAGIVSSDEANIPDKDSVSDPEAFISEQFRKLLGRNPGVYELVTFANAWESDPAVGPSTIIRAIIGSREYQSF